MLPSLNNFQLEKLGGFKHFYFQKSLPELRDNRFYLINLDNKQGSEGDPNTLGTHWVLLATINNKVHKKLSIYLDSFGNIPSDLIMYRIRKYTKNDYYNKTPFQNLDSNLCGYYTIIFKKLIQKYKNNKNLMKKIDEFINKLKSMSTEQKEQLILNILNE